MIGFAIAGCGHIAQKHAEAMAAAEGAFFSGAYDTNRIQAERFCGRYGGIPFRSYDELLDSPEVDAVCICTPSGLHAQLAVRAAQAGKHVVVEKPIALTLADADAIIEACRRSGVKLAVVHPNRFRPAVRELRAAMERGAFGRLSHVNATVRWNRDQAYYDQADWRGTRALDGGVLMNQAIHSLDLLLWLVGPVHSVQAHTVTRLRRIECEDVALALLDFHSGAVGVIEAATTVYPRSYEETISIFGETGSAVIGGPTAHWIKHWSFADLSAEETKRLVAAIEAEPYGLPGHQHIIADMVEAIVHDRAPAVTGEHGREALRLVLDIYEAAEQREALARETASAG